MRITTASKACGSVWTTRGATIKTLCSGAALVVGIAIGLPPAVAAWQEVVPGQACPKVEGKPLPGPMGLTFCSGTARVTIRAAEEPQAGVRIVEVAPGSVGEAAGFRPGDVVYRAAGTWVSTGPDAIKPLESLAPGQEAIVNFWRDGLPFLIRVRPGV
jgi:hypothetical protein